MRYNKIIMNTIKNLNVKLNNIAERLQDFFYGHIFPVSLCLAVLFFWIADLSIIGFAFILISLSVIFILYRDLTPALPVIFIIPMAFRDMDIFSTIPPYILIGITAIALVINLIRFPFKKIKIDGVFIALAVLSVVFLFGGIFSNGLTNYLGGLGVVAIVGPAMLAVHFLIKNRITPPEQVDVKIKFCASFLTAVCLACAQLIYAVIATYTFDYMCFGDIYGIILPKTERNPTFCWANLCHFAYLIMFALPFCCYMITRAKKLWPWFVLLFFLYFSMILTTGDTPLGLSILAIIPLAFAVYKNIDAKKKTLFIKLFNLALVGVLVVVVGLFFTGLLETIINKFLHSFVNDNGRSRLYIQAWGLFISNPLFGTSFGNSASTIMNSKTSYAGGFFHSTIMHTLASAGIVGLLAFAFLYVQRFRAIGKNSTVFSYFALISILMFSVYATVDNGEYHFTVLYATIIIAFTSLINEKGNDETVLPLSIKPFNKVICR